MKKIAIVAPYKEYNYGTVLQAYALQFTLIKNGMNNEILNYKPSKFDKMKFFFTSKAFTETVFLMVPLKPLIPVKIIVYFPGSSMMGQLTV